MKKYTKEKMFEYIEQWKSSKITQEAFCNKAGISYYSFKYWVHKYKLNNAPNKVATIVEGSEPDTFLPVNFSSMHSVGDISSQIEIFFPGGIQMNCPMEIDFKRLKELLGV
jgi:hypothetical protein